MTKVEVSKTDSDLGESDITVVADIDNKLYGFLIEDKIDAIAMPNQHERYIDRGKLGIKNGEYSEFRVFIFCPRKYYDNNSEAQLYEHQLFYEECKDYFDKKSSSSSKFKSHQLEQAISKAKKPTTRNVNEEANAFLRRYIEYQKANYPSLDIATKEDANGYWIEYRTSIKYLWIVQKNDRGHLDLTFNKSGHKLSDLKRLAEWAREHGIDGVTAVKTGNSSSLRINIPILDYRKGFDLISKDDMNKCLEAALVFTELVEAFRTFSFMLEEK